MITTQTFPGYCSLACVVSLLKKESKRLAMRLIIPSSQNLCTVGVHWNYCCIPTVTQVPSSSIIMYTLCKGSWYVSCTL